MHNCAQKENWLNYLKVNKEGPTWARSKIHSREWDDEDEEDGENIDFIVPQTLTDGAIKEALGEWIRHGQKVLVPQKEG